jgi:hypothetical protein
VQFRMQNGKAVIYHPELKFMNLNQNHENTKKILNQEQTFGVGM